MSDDVLNQSDVENLLNAMDSTPAAAASRKSSAVEAAPSRLQNKVVAYDFKRPERVGKEQMRALQTLHEGFARNFGAGLSAMLRSIVEVKLTSVDQLTYSEFVFSLENPTCFNLIKADPLEGHLILDMNPSILFPIIDRMLGGGREEGPGTRRPLTDIELRLVSRITGLFLEEMKRAWESVLDLNLEVVQVESNPQLVQIVPPNEVIVLISFELTLADVRGMVNLCVPFNSIERIGHKLSANSWVAYGSKNASSETMQTVAHRLSGSRVELVAHLADTTLATGDLLGLRVGDIIATEQDVHVPITVCVEGVPKFKAYPGAIKGHKAIQVEGTIDAPQHRRPSNRVTSC